MGASQERAAFFNATLLVVTRHRGCIPAGRQANGKFTLPSRFAFHFTISRPKKKIKNSPVGRQPPHLPAQSALSSGHHVFLKNIERKTRIGFGPDLTIIGRFIVI
jgi:hypothetical protein